MSGKVFAIKLSLTILLTIGYQFIISTFLDFTPHINFIGILWGTFIGLSIITYMFGVKISKSSDKYAFSRFSLAHTFLKMMILIMIVAVYHLKFSPNDIQYIWLFLGMYILFTIFETNFLYKLAQE